MNLLKYDFKDKFFEKIYSYKTFGDSIAQHGTFHQYTSKSSGILKINKQSEFAGHSYEYQYNLIKFGKEILLKNNCWQPIFMAPSHSFDDNTLIALRKLEFKSLTDGYGLYPFTRKGIVFVPQLTHKPFNLGFGLATICLHANSLNKKEIKNFINFIYKNRRRIINYEDYVTIKKPPRILCKTLEVLTKKTIQSVRTLKKVNSFLKNIK